MKIEIVYVYRPGGHTQAWRFVNTYCQNLPMAEHSTTIVCNGPAHDMEAIFALLPNCTLMPHDNTGWDIGAFQAASRMSKADMILFLGSSTYCRRPGWLNRMADAFLRNGPLNLYGAMGNNGHSAVGVFPHLRTTAFWTCPGLFNRYPHKCTDPAQRYPIEHGPFCITQWVRDQGLKAFAVDWEGEWEHPHFNDSPNGYQRGNQSALLMGDRLTEPPYFAFP